MNKLKIREYKEIRKKKVFKLMKRKIIIIYI